MTRLCVLGLVLLAAAALLAQCTGVDTSAGLPALPEEAAGWRAHGDPQHYGADDLYLYINGGAVTWIECGFHQVAAREYTNDEQGRLTLEIFEMRDAEAAGCIYQRRAGEGGEALDLGDGGRLYDYYLEFRHGRFLVTVTSLSASAAHPSELTALATEVAELLIPRIEPRT